MKQCTMCGESFPATLEYFYKHRDGLESRCKQCGNQRTYKSRRQHPEKFREATNRYRSKPENRIKAIRYQVQYREQNKEKITLRAREYQRANPEKTSVYRNRRRARKLGLPDTFTPQEWINCLEYFHFCCAVCGCQLRDLLGEVEPHADHWIPLSSELCTGTIAKNMVCLCNDCNFSKNSKLPEQWLVEKYGKRKASKIFKRVQNYFDSLP